MTRAAFLCCVLLAVGSEVLAVGLQCALEASVAGRQPTRQPTEPLTIPLGQELTATSTDPIRLTGGLNPATTRWQLEGTLGAVPITPLTIRSGQIDTTSIFLIDRRFRHRDLIIDPLRRGYSFVDPFTSTQRQADFRSGPEWRYDPSTGDATIFAPPLLARGDEFGRRATYSPKAISIHANGLLVANPSTPNVREHRRVSREVIEELLENDTFDDLIAPDNNLFSYAASEAVDASRVEVFGDQGLVLLSDLVESEFSGVEIEFSSLLASGLGVDESSIFDRRLLPLPPDSSLLIPFAFGASEALVERINNGPADVTVLVSYTLDQPIAGFEDDRVVLIATPTIVPEPSAVVIVLMSFAATLLPRRFAPRVA